MATSIGPGSAMRRPRFMARRRTDPLCLFDGEAERAIPVAARRILLEPGDARQMQVVKLLAGARKLAALVDQFARLVPLLRAHRFEDVVVERRQRAEFR